MVSEEFRRRVRRFVEEAFPASEGWSVEEKTVDKKFETIVMRRRGAIAIGRLLQDGLLSKSVVKEVSDLRDMNQGYLALIYCAPAVEVDREAAALSTRLGVRIVQVR